MKKSLVALAIFGAYASVAQAQSAVIVYGSFDGGVRQVDNVDAAGNNKTSVGSNGNYYSNRLGFKGTEDLGNGLNAHFVLESGFNTGTGAAADANRLFGRAASVGLGGAFGSVDLGRQYSVSFETIGAYDPFNYKYTSIIPLAGTNGAAAGGVSVPGGAANTANNFGGPRFDNDIKYTGKFNGVTLRAEYAPGEVAGASNMRSASAIGLAYAAGPFSVGAAFTEKKIAPVATAGQPSFTDKAWTVGGAYAMGPFRVAAGYNNEKIEGATAFGVAAAGDAKQRIGWLGGSYLITPAFELTAAWYQTRLDAPAAAAVAAGVAPALVTPAFVANAAGTGKRNLAILGATYSLSKRTKLYADIDTTKLDGNQVLGYSAVTGITAPANENRTTGLSLGISHLF